MHLAEVPVETRALGPGSKEVPVGANGAPCDHDAVQLLLVHERLDLSEGVRRTPEGLRPDVGHVGMRLGPLRKSAEINVIGDLTPALAEKKADPGVRCQRCLRSTAGMSWTIRARCNVPF